jgi:hypothetical protein
MADSWAWLLTWQAQYGELSKGPGGQGRRRVLPANFTRLSYRDSKFYPKVKRVNAWLRLIAQVRNITICLPACLPTHLPTYRPACRAAC